MPEELHDSSATGIIFLCVDDPLSELDVVFSRSFQDLFARHGELRAACCADEFGRLEEFLCLSVLRRWVFCDGGRSSRV